MSRKGLVFWPLFSLLMGQVSLSEETKTTDLQPPDLSTLKTNNASSEELSKAKVLIEKGEFQKALPILEHLFKKAPDDPAALFYLGYTRENLRDTAGAISAYEAFLKKNPQPEVYFRVGLLALGRGALPEATTAFQRAAEARRIGLMHSCSQLTRFSQLTSPTKRFPMPRKLFLWIVRKPLPFCWEIFTSL
jgi:tetratricopeptide (TPR) repeat protein